MAENLWAPWRMEYIVGTKSAGCVFCTALAEGPDRHGENLVLYTGKHAFIIMNLFPYTHGHLMVLPKKHVSSLDELNREELNEIFSLVVEAQAAVRQALAPQGINLGMNIGKAAGAGIDDHLHMHVVPRWNGDTNFMPLLAEARCMPEHLRETYLTYKPYFDEIAKENG
jgi:ATP adenylyltransferase